MKPYDGNVDSSMWEVKMRAVLIKEKYWTTVKAIWLDQMTKEKRIEMGQHARFKVMLRLTNEVAI